MADAGVGIAGDKVEPFQMARVAVVN